MTFHLGSGLFWGWGWLAGVGVIILLGVFLLPWFFFLLNLQNLLNEVSPANRRMSPSLVWLNFIPVFHLGWFVYTVIKVRDSVSAEFQSRGWFIDGDLGYNVGLTAGILWIAAFFIGWIPFIGWVLPLAGVICWIIYWLKSSDLKHRLEGPPIWTRPGVYPSSYPPAVAPYGPGYPQPYTPQGASGAMPPGPAAGSPLSEERPAGQPEGAAQQPGDAAGRPGGEPSGAAVAASAADAGTQAEGGEKICAGCGSKFDPGDRFCRSCGLPLPG
jgi:hypothetical protein